LRPPFAAYDKFDLDDTKPSTSLQNPQHSARTPASRPHGVANTIESQPDESSIQGKGTAEEATKQGSLPPPPQGQDGLKAAHPIMPQKQRSPAEEETETEGPGWWTFTLPSKAIKKLEEYMTGNGQEESGDSSQGSHGHGGDVEKQGSSDNLNEESTKTSMGPQHDPWSMLVARPKATPQDYSRNQANTPGWNQPWAPFRRQNLDPWNGAEMVSEGPADQTKAGAQGSKKDRYFKRMQRFLLYSAFAPLWLRFFNLALVAISLAISIRIHIVEDHYGVPGIIGVSTYYTMVVACLSILHIFWSTWFEYFGKPIGVWSIRTKMLHTFVLSFWLSVDR